MSASADDKAQKLGGASSLVNTPKVTSSRSAGSTTLAVDNCNWDQTTGKVFATYQVDSSGDVIDGTQTIWRGVVTSSTAIGSMARIAGASDSGNDVGDYVELLPASAWGNNLVDAFLHEHTNPDGAHGDITTTSIDNSGATKTDTINEHTTNSGVTVDGVLMKDNKIQTTGSLSPKYTKNDYKFRVYNATSGVTAGTTAVVMAADTAVFDTGSNVDLVTNKGRFTAPVDGFYWFSARSESAATTTNRMFISLYKNGSEILRGNDVAYSSASHTSFSVSGILQLSANDYVDVRIFAASNTLTDHGEVTSYFEGFMVSAT